MKTVVLPFTVALTFILAHPITFSQAIDHRDTAPKPLATRLLPALALPGTPDSVHSRTILRKTGATQGRPFVIDTAIAYAFADTTRQLYTFNSNAIMTSSLSQTLTAGTWVDMLRYTYTYDERDRMTGQSMERRLNGVMTLVNRNTCTYDARGNPATDTYELLNEGTKRLEPWYTASFLFDPHGLTLLEQVEYLSGGTTRGGSRVSYARDDAGNEVSVFIETWDRGWTPYIRVTTTRDDHARPIAQVREQQLDQHMVNTDRTDRTYDSRGNPLSETSADWVDGEWRPTTRMTYAYDAEDNITILMYEAATEGKFRNATRSTRSYEGGKQRTEVLEQWTDSTWSTQYRVSHDYDTNGDRISSTRYEFGEGRWSMSDLRTYSYDASRRLTGITAEAWQDGRLYGASHEVWQYNANGDEILSLHESIDSLGQISGGNRTISTYDPYGMPAGLTFDTWKDGTWRPEELWWSMLDSAACETRSPHRTSQHNAYSFSGYRVELRSSAIGPPSPEPATVALLQNYPNPFNAGTQITYTVSTPLDVRLTIYDLLGREVARPVDGHQGPGTFSVPVSAAGLSTGVYFYVLQAGTSIEAKKMILVK